MFYSIQVVHSMNLETREDRKLYVPRWGKVNCTFCLIWHSYSPMFETWEEAYKELEQRTNPAVLAVRFVGTF